MTRNWKTTGNWKIVAAAVLAAAVAGCASEPPPVAEIASARTMMTQASPDASRYAPQLLREAQSKLALAEVAMSKGDNEQARRLAEKAEADARLAWASAEHQRSQQALAEVNQGIQVLKQELDRRTQ
jgi:hypothetical protein